MQSEKQKYKIIKRNNVSLRDLWDNTKHNNICIIRIPEGEEREKGIENIFEQIMIKNLHNLMKKKIHKSSGSSESLKQDGSKEVHTKTHYH